MIEIKHKQTGEVLLRVNADSLEGANLSGAKLAGANLFGVKINHACLRDVDLQGAMLNTAELIGTCLDGANLTQATMEAADLTDASLQNADLSRACLVEATMRYAKLTGANLSQARLTGANLSMADARANLRGANLQSADLRGANLSGANLQQADLFQADLSGATMTKAVVAGARTQGAKMRGVINDDGASRIEAASRVSVIRRNPASSAGNVQPNGRIVVHCPFCNQHQEVPPQRLEHHSRCVTCNERFFVDRLGHAHVPRRADPNQWTPELSSMTIPRAAAATWEWPRQLTRPLLAMVAVLLLGCFGWGLLRWALAPSYEVPDSLLARAAFVGDAFAAGDVDRLSMVTATGGRPAIESWLGKKRLFDWTRANEGNPDVKVDAKVLFEDTTNKRCGVLTIVRCQQRPDSKNNPLEVELITFWEQTSANHWMLDAESTARGGNKPLLGRN